MKILIDGQTLDTQDIRRGIGITLVNTLDKLLFNGFQNVYYLTLRTEKNLNVFSNWALSQLKLIKNNNENVYNFNNENDYESNIQTYSKFIEEEINKQKIDIYWNPNPLMTNVLLPDNLGTAKYVATIHDIIPIALKNIYFENYSETTQRHYLRKIDCLKKYEML